MLFNKSQVAYLDFSEKFSFLFKKKKERKCKITINHK